MSRDFDGKLEAGQERGPLGSGPQKHQEQKLGHYVLSTNRTMTNWMKIASME